MSVKRFEPELKETTIKASRSRLSAGKLKKKKQVVEIFVRGSDGKVTIENRTNTTLARKVKIGKQRIVFKKHAKKGVYTFRVTVAGNEIYRDAVETITIVVK